VTLAKSHDYKVARLARAAFKNQNLRAFLLRIEDGDFLDRTPEAAIRSAVRRGLVVWHEEGNALLVVGRHRLTGLGVDVAAKVRPRPWATDISPITGGPTLLVSDQGNVGLAIAWERDTGLFARIIDLLNADDLAAAKRYETP
jgi:hypothetical protein